MSKQMETLSIEEPKTAALYKARDVLRKYLLPDCLKPEYDGMNSWEITKLVVQAYEDEMNGQMVEDMPKDYNLENDEEHGIRK